MDNVFDKLQVPQTDGTTAMLKEVISGTKIVDEIPIRTTQRQPNRHYNDPNYSSSSQLNEEAQYRRLRRERRGLQNMDPWENSIKPQYNELGNRYWDNKQQKYQELARKHAKTVQNDNIYIRAITLKEEQNLKTPL
jgi:hypothetical protein